MTSTAELPPFPTDEFTLNQLEHAINTTYNKDGELVGGEFTLDQLLNFMSGYDPDNCEIIGYANGIVDENELTPVYRYLGKHYSPQDVIRSLIKKIRERENLNVPD